MVGDVSHGESAPPVQPAAAEHAQLILFRGLFQLRQQILAGIRRLHFQEESEGGQTGDDGGNRGGLEAQTLAQRIQAVCPAEGRAAEGKAFIAAGQKELRHPGHGLAQIDDQSLRAGRVHRVAEAEYLIAGAQRMKQAADAAVDPGLVRQAGIVPVIGAESAAVLKEAACGLAVAGVEHAVRAGEDLRPVSGGQKLPAGAGFAENSRAIAGEQLPHGGIALLHGDNGSAFLSGEKQVSQKGGQEHRNVLPDHCKFHSLFSVTLTPRTAFFPLISHSLQMKGSAGASRFRLRASVPFLIMSAPLSTAAASSSSAL